MTGPRSMKSMKSMISVLAHGWLLPLPEVPPHYPQFIDFIDQGRRRGEVQGSSTSSTSSIPPRPAAPVEKARPAPEGLPSPNRRKRTANIGSRTSALRAAT
jgi:hypothetical protein